MLLAERVCNLFFLIVFTTSLFFPAHVFAETVSILTESDRLESNLVEAALKRNLRAEGYTVKGGTTDGYLLLVGVMPNITKGGYKRGVTGHLTVSSLSWQDVADTLVSENCKQEHAFAQSFKEIVGTRLIYINSYMATASDEEKLAEMMSTFANRAIRTTSRKVTEFFEDVRRRSESETSAPSLEQTR